MADGRHFVIESYNGDAFNVFVSKTVTSRFSRTVILTGSQTPGMGYHIQKNLLLAATCLERPHF